MTHLIWVTNIPSPYRNHRYELFAEVFPTLGLSFEVAYMAETEPGRFWKFGRNELTYPHKFFRGSHWNVRGIPLHTNPGLVAYVRRRRPDLLVVGGYTSPTTLALSLFTPPGAKLVLALDTQRSDAGHRAKPIAGIKKLVVGKSDAYVGPGRRTSEYLTHLNPVAAQRPFIRLPNIVDARVFRDGVDAARRDRKRLRARLGVADDEQLWLIPARLEKIKGLHLFLPLFANTTGQRVLVAGDGSQRAELERLCRDQRLPVRFLGNQPEERLKELYAAADVFALPSLHDASPLAAIEAAAAGLPVLLSVRAGNVDEVLSGDNGWRYDPDRLDEMAGLIRHIGTLTHDELARIGAESRRVYDAEFDSKAWVLRTGRQLLSLTGR